MATPRGVEGSSAMKKVIFTVRYRDCMRNHALALGSHATDGCGEFMPAGEEGSAEALTCAACSCHRNFHRKVTEENVAYQPQLQPLHQSAPPQVGYLQVSPISQHRVVTLEDVGGQSCEKKCNVVSPTTSPRVKKRFRTKFTSDQKEKMLRFAEHVGWKIKKKDEIVAEGFCGEVGVNMRVLKIWLQNNKHTLGNKP